MSKGTERPSKSPPTESAIFRARVLAEVEAASAERDKCIKEAEEIEEDSGSSCPALALDPEAWVRVMSQYASVVQKLASGDPRKLPLPKRSLRGRWERSCAAWADAVRGLGTARLEMAQASACVRTGDTEGAAEHAFSAGVALGTLGYAFDAAVAEARRKADEANVNKHSWLTREERLDVGRFAYERALHYLTGKFPVSLEDARGRACRDAYKHGVEKYGKQRMPKRTKQNRKYPERYMEGYMKENRLRLPAPEEQGEQS